MSLNRISNPRKLRRLSERVGAPVIRAYARFFAEHGAVLAFTDKTTAYYVTHDEVERYVDEAYDLELTDGGLREKRRIV